MKQSNRLVVTVNENMEISYESGIQTVYLNSYLYNDFVCRPDFLLAPSQTMWITFKNAVSNPSIQLEPILLAERKTTVTNSTKQVVENSVSNIEQTDESGYEYYLQLPDAVMKNAGQWYFSLQIRELNDSSNPTSYAVISTSDVADFVVNNSLAGVAGGTPTDLDIASLYNQAKQAATDAASSAAEASQSAAEAQQALEEINSKNYATVNYVNSTVEQSLADAQSYTDTAIANAITKALNTPV